MPYIENDDTKDFCNLYFPNLEKNEYLRWAKMMKQRSLRTDGNDSSDGFEP